MSKVFTTASAVSHGMTNTIVDYFSSRKPVPVKNINAQVDRNKWEVVKEYAKYQGCPQKRVEDALVCFALDCAHEEAMRAQATPEFKRWQENNRRRKRDDINISTEANQ